VRHVIVGVLVPFSPSGASASTERATLRQGMEVPEGQGTYSTWSSNARSICRLSISEGDHIEGHCEGQLAAGEGQRQPVPASAS